MRVLGEPWKIGTYSRVRDDCYTWPFRIEVWQVAYCLTSKFEGNLNVEFYIARGVKNPYSIMKLNITWLDSMNFYKNNFTTTIIRNFNFMWKNFILFSNQIEIFTCIRIENGKRLIHTHIPKKIKSYLYILYENYPLEGWKSIF